MRYLSTRCPKCLTSFYSKIHGDSKADIECPYCGEEYGEYVNEEQVKEADFYWELYINLYPQLRKRGNNSRFLKIGGVFLIASILINSITIINEYLVGTPMETISPTVTGLLLSSFIFLGFTVIGCASIYLKYSYPIAVSGAFFGGFNSMLLYLYGTYSHVSVAPFSSTFNASVSFFFSLLALFIIIINRWVFLRY